jgi:serine phosphatase RsbU (regulator of sigma subunit)
MPASFFIFACEQLTLSKMRLLLLRGFFGVIILSFISGSQAFAQLHTADSLKRVLAVTTDSTRRISLLLRLSDAYMQYAPKKALDPAADARYLAARNGNDSLEALSFYTLGKVHYKTANYKEALSFLDLAAKRFHQNGDESSYTSVLITTSNTYLDKGELNLALDKSLEAYQLAEKRNDKKNMSKALITSGNVYRGTANYDKAISDYEKALSIARGINDSEDEASCLNNIANIYGDKGENQKSIEYLEQARVIHERTGDKYSLAKVLNNIGAGYFEEENYDKATSYFLQALEIRKQIGDKRGMSTALGNLGSVSLEQGKPDKAIEYLNRALEIAVNIGSIDLQVNIYESLSEAYARMEDYEKSLMFSRKYSALKDSIFDENLSESIAEMQARYDVEKAGSEARAQQKQKQIITFAAAGGGVLLLLIVAILWNRTVLRKKANVRLNQQKQEIQRKNFALNEANKEIELKNKDITDSIIYARKIQEAILPEVEFSSTFGEKGFVFYRPKDIVSGDFFWMEQTPGHLLFAAVDCTGHGVPGAFMSIVCSNLLSQSVRDRGLTEPKEILNDVNIRLSETLRQRQDESRVRDGMDIALCSIERKTLKLQFAGAFNPAWIFRGQKLTEIPGDKFPVGLFVEEELRQFTGKEFQLEPGDRIYVFTDGYSDQFGGENGKKYKRSVFCDFILNIQSEPIASHRRLLEEEHFRWKGENDQIDDILVMGIEI